MPIKNRKKLHLRPWILGVKMKSAHAKTADNMAGLVSMEQNAQADSNEKGIIQCVKSQVPHKLFTKKILL